METMSGLSDAGTGRRAGLTTVGLCVGASSLLRGGVEFHHCHLRLGCQEMRREAGAGGRAAVEEGAVVVSFSQEARGCEELLRCCETARRSGKSLASCSLSRRELGLFPLSTQKKPKRMSTLSARRDLAAIICRLVQTSAGGLHTFAARFLHAAAGWCCRRRFVSADRSSDKQLLYLLYIYRHKSPRQRRQAKYKHQTKQTTTRAIFNQF